MKKSNIIVSEAENLGKKNEKESLFRWWYDSFMKSEDQVHKEAGHDVLMYLKYTKYTMFLFWCMFIFSGANLMILYSNLSKPINQT